MQAHPAGPLPRWFSNLSGGERALLALTVFGFGFTLVDPAVYELARKLDPHTRSLFETITRAGRSGWILWTAGLALVVLTALRTSEMSRRARVAFNHWIGVFGFTFLAVAGSGLLNQIIKTIVGRARPELYDTLGPLAFHPFAFSSAFASLPSGHAATIFALAMVLAAMVPRLRVLSFTVAVWVAASRFIVGTHYFTDVIAGGLLGAGFTYWLARFCAARRVVFDMREGQIRMRGTRLTRWLWNSALGEVGTRPRRREPARPVEAEELCDAVDSPQPEGTSLARRLTGFRRGWRLWSRP